MGSMPPDVEKAAARFRHYAALCEEAAQLDSNGPIRARLLIQAARWRRDAETLERDARLVAESKELLARVETLLNGNRPP